MSSPSITNADEPPDVESFLAESRRAAKRIARQGFSPDEWNDGAVLEGFAVGAPLVAGIVMKLEAFLARLGKLSLPGATWERQFEADKATFTAGFRRIYGVSE